MWPAVKQGFTQEEFRKYVHDLPASKWHPSMIVWHNTAAPSLAQWEKSAIADRAAGRKPGITRIGNLETFFREDNHWSGCPHLFIDEDLIWVMNPLTAPGVHTPSWNSISLGIEMVGDFATEDDDHGAGLRVKQNTIYATAVLCEAFGIPVVSGEIISKRPLKWSGNIFLHKQDPATEHDCPGEHIAVDKEKMILAVQDLMTGGEHQTSDGPIPIRAGVVTINNLNFRTGPSASSAATGTLYKGIVLEILAEAANATTKWLKVKTPAGHIGWVAGKYIEEK